MKTELLAAHGGRLSDAGLARVLGHLRAGRPVALPTETVYGLAADALSPMACAAIFEAKRRPLSDPLIVHVADTAWLGRICERPEAAGDLAAAFWPGPLTVVLPRAPVVPDLVTAGQSTVAVRQSAHPVMRQVLEAFGRPLAAPSANRFGRISPTTAAHVVEELGGGIPLVVDAGSCDHGIESTIVLVGEDGVAILREGPVTREALEAVTPVHHRAPGVRAPGLMKSHYAPATPLLIARSDAVPESRKLRAGFLAWSEAGEGFAVVERLAAAGDLRGAAAGLYGAMRRLDAAGLDLIVAEPVPEQGLGVAIMDRLRKAAARGQA